MQVYIQFNDASAAYVTMLPAAYTTMLQAPNTWRRRTRPHCELPPNETTSCNAAGSLCCNAADCQHVAIPHCKPFPSEAPNCNAPDSLCCNAAGFQLPTCFAHLRVLYLLKTACRKNCSPNRYLMMKSSLFYIAPTNDECERWMVCH
jgi:hypothetical protein